ncbi:MAG: hypothetical protein QOF01_803 [Thermomicrobiales bacterium]|nr:hypothetical protein [Thermomicrobiales bacterium]
MSIPAVTSASSAIWRSRTNPKVRKRTQRVAEGVDDVVDGLLPLRRHQRIADSLGGKVVSTGSPIGSTDRTPSLRKHSQCTNTRSAG